jgi:hypothetical protein
MKCKICHSLDMRLKTETLFKRKICTGRSYLLKIYECSKCHTLKRETV